ncbi:MAG: type III pantothenate kinase [Spirochaetia bacterium]|nr:type III pantothenate kinase [Spirochaetia bacterium]
MVLVFNIGNTNISIGTFQGNTLVFKARIRTNINYTEDQYFAVLYALLTKEGIDTADIDGAFIGSVVPGITRIITHMARKYFRVEPVTINGKSKIGIRNLYKNKKEVGDDRLANAAAARAQYGKKELVVIDFGTGTTFDVVTSTGGYIGGVIMPGLNLMLQSLFSRTAKLPQVDLKFPKNVIGDTTETSIQSGLLNGLIGSINHLIEGIKKERGIKKIKVVLTGGDADLIPVKLLKEKDVTVDKDLTLKGFKLIYDINTKTGRVKI